MRYNFTCLTTNRLPKAEYNGSKQGLNREGRTAWQETLQALPIRPLVSSNAASGSSSRMFLFSIGLCLGRRVLIGLKPIQRWLLVFLCTATGWIGSTQHGCWVVWANLCRLQHLLAAPGFSCIVVIEPIGVWQGTSHLFRGRLAKGFWTSRVLQYTASAEPQMDAEVRATLHGGLPDY